MSPEKRKTTDYPVTATGTGEQYINPNPTESHASPLSADGSAHSPYGLPSP